MIVDLCGSITEKHFRLSYTAMLGEVSRLGHHLLDLGKWRFLGQHWENV